MPQVPATSGPEPAGFTHRFFIIDASAQSLRVWQQPGAKQSVDCAMPGMRLADTSGVRSSCVQL